MAKSENPPLLLVALIVFCLAIYCGFVGSALQRMADVQKVDEAQAEWDTAAFAKSDPAASIYLDFVFHELRRKINGD